MLISNLISPTPNQGLERFFKIGGIFVKQILKCGTCVSAESKHTQAEYRGMSGRWKL